MAKSPTTTTAPTGQIAPFGLRMLPELKGQIEAAAKASGRSMNAEIVARLDDSFAPENPPGLWSFFVSMIRDNLDRNGARSEDEVKQLVRAIDGLLYFLEHPQEHQSDDAIEALFKVISKERDTRSTQGAPPNAPSPGRG